MGKRYTREEMKQVNSLAAEGLTNEEIATRLCRSEAAIRNLRYRKKIKTATLETIESLKQKRDDLRKKIFRLELNHSNKSSEIKSLQTRKEKLSEAISLDEQTLK